MAEKITYHLARSAEGQAITVFIPGKPPKIAVDTHPKFKAIRALLSDDAVDPDEFMAMFESKTPMQAIGRKFEQLSDRVSAREGKIFFDGDEVHNTVADVILGLMTEGQDFLPVVRFLEKIQDNPNENSREQAYRWISSQKLTITANGDVVGYKGCKRRGDGILQSTSRGKATVDGIEYQGYIPYPLGSVATMPRSEVVHDPGSACSTGIHVGTHSYAQHYGLGGAVLEVHVNPRDIVSVPRGEDEKMRVCRLRVVKEITAKYETTLRSTHSPLPEVESSPPVDSEFADCVMCATCGECKTHNECICEEAARQQTDLDAENAEEREQRQGLIRSAAARQGFDWEPDWTEGPNPVASFGTFRVLEDDDDNGIAEGDEGALKAEVVGAQAYRNERVMFALEFDDREGGFEVDPSNVEYCGTYSPAEVVRAVEEIGAVEGPVDESGLEPESLYLDEDEVEEQPEPALVQIEDDPPADGFIVHPSKKAFALLQAKSKTRRRPIRSLVNESKSINWTLIEGDGSKREHWSI